MGSYKARRVPFLVPALIDVGGLRRNDSVLDLGCGTGAFAEALLGHLGETARFEGLDVMPKAVDTARKRIARPNFNFHLADVCNSRYNPGGRERAETYRFPFPDASFDFVCALSLFTHMELAAVEQYLRETARVLKKGGRCFFTYFILSDDARDSGRVPVEFPMGFGAKSRVRTTEVPEAKIAHEELAVRQGYASAGLRIVPPIHYGRWAGNSSAIDRQDVVVAGKTQSSDSTAGNLGFDSPRGRNRP
ncbi:MAG: class I SAM-dependent methyltransferase [Arenicellales bacterium]